jgi:hypothetical protein
MNFIESSNGMVLVEDEEWILDEVAEYVGESLLTVEDWYESAKRKMERWGVEGTR